MAYADPAVGRAKDRERFRKRVAARRAAGLCPKCGRRPPASDRSTCEPCAEKTRAAGRARDAKLRAESKPRRDMEGARQYERQRSRRQTADRVASGICTKCGKAPAEPDRSLCEPCLVKRRADDRASYARAKAAGRLYGGKDPQVKRKAARIASRKRQETRREAGQCTRCGRRRPVEGGATCEDCREARHAAERELYAARRAAGLCTRCGGSTTDGGSRCAPCAVLEAEHGHPERKNEAARRRYWGRRAAGRCTDCGRPSQGDARCEPCARRSYGHSDYFRGMPVYPPSFTVVLIETDETVATFDDEMEVAAWLAFERLSRDQFEVLVDRSPMQTMTGWE